MMIERNRVIKLLETVDGSDHWKQDDGSFSENVIKDLIEEISSWKQ